MEGRSPMTCGLYIWMVAHDRRSLITDYSLWRRHLSRRLLILLSFDPLSPDVAYIHHMAYFEYVKKRSFCPWILWYIIRLYLFFLWKIKTFTLRGELRQQFKSQGDLASRWLKVTLSQGFWCCGCPECLSRPSSRFRPRGIQVSRGNHNPEQGQKFTF